MSNIFKNGINIPKVVKKLELSGYADELKGEFIEVWVNPTRADHKAYTDLQTQLLNFRGEGADLALQLNKETDRNEKVRLQKRLDKFTKKIEKEADSLNDAMYAWYARIWAQGKGDVSAEDVRTIAKSSGDQDDGVFWAWITKQTQAMILAHRNSHLKN